MRHACTKYISALLNLLAHSTDWFRNLRFRCILSFIDIYIYCTSTMVHRVILGSVSYHDPGAYVFAPRVLCHRFLKKHLKQTTQRHHCVAVTGGHNLLQGTKPSFNLRELYMYQLTGKTQTKCERQFFFCWFVLDPHRTENGNTKLQGVKLFY